MQITDRPAGVVTHPLDPLTAEEIARASSILRRDWSRSPAPAFMRITLQEPAKADVLAYQEGEPIAREALIILRERPARTTYEAVVSISGDSVRSVRELPGAQPAITFEEFAACQETIRRDPLWQAAMRKRGVTDFSLAMIDAWSAGYYGPDDDPSRRLVRALTWVRSEPGDNGYARPVENLLTLVDLDSSEVVRVDDFGVVPLPPRSGNYGPESISNPANVPHFDRTRADVKPLAISQPDGVSFQVSGHEVRWQKWRFRVGFTAREGLVLHTVAYEDNGSVRPIIYRASISEMLIPYGDPGATHWRKNAFDEGEYGIGMLANALELGCDCLGEIYYFDAVVSDAAGEPLTLPNAICMHEEDFGLLWKHTDWRSRAVEVRRSRRLAVSFIATVGNYDYGFYWYFYQDGTIEFQVKLTGVISTGALQTGERPEFGEIVAPGLYGPNHQHFFNIRLDMTVDGPKNSVYEVESQPLQPGPSNPYGNAWVQQQTLLAGEAQAQRLIDPLHARHWKVVNPSVANAVGNPVGYKLLPGENVLSMIGPEAAIARRGAFMSHHLWVTAFDPAELYAAGDYPNQHPGGAGLPAYVAAGRPLENADIVLWYTMGTHHVVRPEDWPVMPVSTIGFQLKPAGFFDGNPALDLPRPDRCEM